jgi:ATP-dependent Clp protease ATP-binding subunit ClpA
VQISLRSRATTLAKAELIGPEFQKLAKALIASPETIPFFRDFHLVQTYGLGTAMAQFAIRSTGPVLAEGDGQAIQALFDQEPDLESEFALVPVAAPPESRLARIVLAWAADGRHGAAFEPEAMDAAIALSNRFLARRGQPRAALEVLANVTGRSRAVGEGDVVERFVEVFDVPALLVDRRTPFEPLQLRERLRATVVEQDEAVDAAVRMMVRVRAGLADPRRPLGAFLLIGPTGVGKTLIAQALAGELFGSSDRLVRLNMADYPDEWDDHELFGHTGAQTLAGKRGVLTARLQGHTVAVLLLDEFEKAHAHVHDRFMQFVDEGVFTNGAGETVSCRSLIVIATSNAGAEVYRENPLGFDSLDAASVRREVDRRVKETFRFELLNRFDEVVYFNRLSRSAVREIAHREIEALTQRAGLRERAIRLDVDDAVLDWLAENGYDARYGARFVRRAIERHLATAVASELVDADATGLDHIALSLEAGRVVARACAPESVDVSAAGA